MRRRFSDELPVFLPYLPVAPLLDVQVLSVRVGVCKPHPALYLTACRQLDLRPQDCLYIGDGGSREQTGARDAGLSAVRLAAADLAGHLVFDPETNWPGPELARLSEVVDLAGCPEAPTGRAGRPRGRIRPYGRMREVTDEPVDQPNVAPPPLAVSSALIDEAVKKAAVAWVQVSGWPAVAVWCVALEGVLHVISGPGEQSAPGLAGADRAVVTLRGDHGGQIVSFPAAVTRVPPESEQWQRVAPLVAAKRLNAPGSPAEVARRWAAECTLSRLTPS